MTENKAIRLATETDCAAILAIYAPFITETIITFENAVPTLAEFGGRMTNIQKKYPWLIVEQDHTLAGYAYASQFSERAAYDWSVDFSIYIKPQYQGKKLGKALYFALAELLKLQGYYNAYAAITLPNMKSESLHQGFGFKPIGAFHKVGYKLGKWRDVKWFELKLQDYSQAPVRPKAIDEIKHMAEFAEIIRQAEQLIAD